MEMIKGGTWCVYNNKEYNFRILDDNSIRLRSEDRSDLQIGFRVHQDDVNGFVCIMDINKECVTKAYKYDTYAVYKGIKCKIVGPFPDKNAYLLETYEWFYPSNDTGLLRKVMEYGFERWDDIGHGIFTFGRYVDPDDPDLHIFEERTEIDVNSL